MLGLGPTGLIVFFAFMVLFFILDRTFSGFKSVGSASARRTISACSPAIAVIVALFVSFIAGRWLPFSKTPRLYKEALALAERRDFDHSVEIKKAIAYCGLGNIYRCLCAIKDLEERYPSDMGIREIRDAVERGMEEQRRSGRFLQ